MKKVLSKAVLISCLCSYIFIGCGDVKENAKEVIVETGKTVGRTGSEFVQGVSEGVEKSLNCTIIIDSALQNKIQVSGKLDFRSENEGKDNVCSIYFIFNNNCNEKVRVKVKDEKGVEYGRSKATVVGKKGEASYIDFVFDKRVNLEAKSTFELY